MPESVCLHLFKLASQCTQHHFIIITIQAAQVTETSDTTLWHRAIARPRGIALITTRYTHAPKSCAAAQFRHENITQPLVKTDNRSVWYHNLNKKVINAGRLQLSHCGHVTTIS